MSVSRETADRLQEYRDLITEWNPRINLVAASTLSQLGPRHIDDSLQIADLTTPSGGLWVDLGSGGGLPGIVLAIAWADRPTRFLLVESDQRKAAFLRTVIRKLGLERVQVKSDRIEALEPQDAAYLSARALAPLGKLMPYLDRHLAKNGQAWLMKGEKWRAEVAEASAQWNFSYQDFPSKTHPDAAIIKISEVSHV